MHNNKHHPIPGFHYELSETGQVFSKNEKSKLKL